MNSAFCAVVLALGVGVVRAENAKVGSLTIEIPVHFPVEAKHQKDSLGDLEVQRWKGEDGQVIGVLYYAKSPKKDRGPM